MERTRRFIFTFLLLSTFSIAVSAAPSYERLAPTLDNLSVKQLPKDNDATVLRKDFVVKLDDRGQHKTTFYKAVYIGSEEAARDYSQIEISYNNYFDHFQLQFANVRTQSGKILPLAADAFIDKASGGRYLSDGRDVTFSLPFVEPGSVIEYQFERSSKKPLIPGHYSDFFIMNGISNGRNSMGARVDPVLSSTVKFEVPESMELHFKQSPATTLKTSSRGGVKTYFWQSKNTEKIELQRGMPSLWEYLDVLEVSTMKDWSTVANWSSELFLPAISGDSDTGKDGAHEFAKIARSINQVAKTKKQKIYEVYKFMQENIRYEFAHVGRGGFQPHRASEVLKNRYGDCKDQTVLAIALLKELGITAYPVFITAGSGFVASNDLPIIAFDHVMVYIPEVEGEAVWFDTTGTKSLFPGYDMMLEGRLGLVSNNLGGEVVKAPKGHGGNNGVTVAVEFLPLENNQLSAKFSLVFEGPAEQMMRSWWRYSDEKNQDLVEMMKSFYSEAEIVSTTATDIDDMQVPFSISGMLQFNGVSDVGDPVQYSAGVIQLLRVFSSLTALDEVANRRQDYQAHNPANLQLNIRIKPPRGGMQPLLIKPGLEVNNRYLSLTQRSELVGSDYEIDISFQMTENVVSLEDYHHFYTAIERASKENIWVVNFVPEGNEQSVQLAGTRSEKGVPTDLKSIHSLVDNGDFDRAFESISAYLKRNPKDGEGFYLLGLIQGYLDDFDGSDKSFEKAQQLGYDI